jgi:hypothetical protein
MEKTATKVNLMELPFMKNPLMQNYSESQIVTKVENFRKGEKNLFWFLQLGAFGAIAYGAWVYVLPPIFQAIGQFMAAAATGLLVLFLVIALPVIIKGIRMLTRGLHKMLIKYKPFDQLAITRQKLIQSISTFRIAKSNLNTLMHDMEIEASNSKKTAEESKLEAIKLKNKCGNIKTEMDDMVNKLGSKAKEEDAYVQLNADLLKKLSQAKISENKFNQSNDFTVKFASRANTLKKINQRLIMVEASMDVKLSQFDSMVDGLKTEYETGRKLNAASTAAKNVLGATSDWEADFALEVISETITNDFATSASNFKDIETLTSGYDLSSDELFENLEAFSNKLESGAIQINDNKKFLNPDYVLTSEDKNKAGSNFSGMF